MSKKSYLLFNLGAQPQSGHLKSHLLSQSSERAEPLEPDDFHKNRRRASYTPERARETLASYGRLRLTVTCARDLLAMNDLVKSDPYVVVHLNERRICESVHVYTNLNPRWDFETTLDIYSPLSIVQIAVRNYNLLTKDDLMGFVEFCVGDIHPNPPSRESGNPVIEGWFELRRPERLVGSASARCRAHGRMRDEHRLDTVEGVQYYMQRLQARGEMVCDGVSNPGTEADAKRGSWDLEAGMSAVVSSASANFRKTARKSSSSSGSPLKKSSAIKHLPNAGEIYVRLEFQAYPEDEWYALCLPPPTFPVRSRKSGEERLTGEFALMELYTDFAQLRELFSIAIRPLCSLITFILSWRWPALSVACLIWCWTVCWWPILLLPSLPLCVSIFLYLIRSEKQLGVDILAHGATAELSDAGFRSIAALDSSMHMMKWMTRIIHEELQGYVKDDIEFHSFAALAFRDGQPVFGKNSSDSEGCYDELVIELQECMKQNKWLCADNLKGKGHFSPGASQHLQSLRAISHEDASSLDSFMSEVMNDGEPKAVSLSHGMRTFVWLNKTKLAEMCDRIQDIIEINKERLGDLIRWGTKLREIGPDGTLRARKVYKSCSIMAIGCLILEKALPHSISWKVVLMLLCTVVLTSKTILMKHALTYYRATQDQKMLHEFRKRQWAFLKPGFPTERSERGTLRVPYVRRGCLPCRLDSG